MKVKQIPQNSTIWFALIATPLDDGVLSSIPYIASITTKIPRRMAKLKATFKSLMLYHAFGIQKHKIMIPNANLYYTSWKFNKGSKLSTIDPFVNNNVNISNS